jgi:hypothetical protein
VLVKFHQNPRFWKFSVNFYRNSTHRAFPNFSSNLVSNLDTLLWGKLFLTSPSFHPYFIWNFWSWIGPPFGQISLSYFKLIQINTKPYRSSGLGHSVSFSGQPTRAHASARRAPLCPVPADRPDPPVSGTAANHCAAAHLSVPPSLFPADNARVTHVWHFRGRTPPLPPFFPLYRAADRPFKTRPNAVRSSLTHSSPDPPSLERHTIPHRSPRPDHRLRPPGAPPSLGFRLSTATIRHTPVSSSPSLQSSQFLAISSPPCPS